MRERMGLVLTLAVLVAGCKPETQASGVAVVAPSTDKSASDAMPEKQERPGKNPVLTETTSGAAMQANTDAVFDGDGKLSVEAGDYMLTLTAEGCSAVHSTLSLCNRNVELTIAKKDDSFNQVLLLEAAYVNSDATLHRGALDKTYENREHSFILSDVNSDGQEDLIVWSGIEGAYGGASYSVYLFDSIAQEFSFSKAFSEVTEGRNGLFTIEHGKLMVSATDGCCLHIFETYEIEADKPKLIERVWEDSSEGRDNIKVKTERLVNGDLRTVSE